MFFYKSSIYLFVHFFTDEGEENPAVDAVKKPETAAKKDESEDESSDDEDEVNEISFEFRENPGWLAFSDSD